jgi:hypothetical protein
MARPITKLTSNRCIPKPCSLKKWDRLRVTTCADLEFFTYLWDVGTDSLDDPLFLGDMNTHKRCKGIRRRARGQNLASQYVCLPQQYCWQHRNELSGSETGVASTSLPNNMSVFPDPSLPQISESSPSGKFSVMSTSINLCLGVDAADGAALPERSCGHVAVQDWKAIVCDWCSMGGTGATSAPLRYFSMRRMETML